jgi:hypothetical protein
MFALQNSSAMGAAVTPWSSTMMMDRISLDDMPHKGRGNILSYRNAKKTILLSTSSRCFLRPPRTFDLVPINGTDFFVP